MPKRRVNELSRKEKECRFISLYVERGAVPQHISYCEKRACLKVGEGVKILTRKAVQEEIERRMQPVRANQLHQATVTEATQKAKAAMEEALAQQVELIKLHKLDFSVLEGRLMQMVLGLNMHTWPKELLEAIKVAMVVHGAIESGHTRRITPPENPQSDSPSGLYTSLFERLKLAPPKTDAPPAAEEAGVYDLIPQAKTTVPPGATMPVAGESIDEPTAPKKTSSRVITVEVG